VSMSVAVDAQVGMGETVVFWFVAPVMVLAALGLLFVKKAVHAALLLAMTMIGMAVLYAAQDAPFLFAAQIVVYTGAVMMLFLFVLMLVGVDASDSLVETLRNHRLPAVLAGAGMAFFLVAIAVGFTAGPFDIAAPQPAAPVGLEGPNADGNPVGVARLVFSDFVLAFELTGALLITAAMGAIMLTHRQRLVPRVTQRVLAERRVREGRHVSPLPAPGVFARHNAVDTPALLPDGTPSELSVSRVLRARGQERSALGLADDVAVIEAEIGADERRGVTGSQFPADEAVDGTAQRSDAQRSDGQRSEAQRSENESERR
jgi:NADH-quinone oxidoreductase subunit J